jgi:hypothetical protein
VVMWAAMLMDFFKIKLCFWWPMFLPTLIIFKIMEINLSPQLL